jgi:hypothetical protein
VRLAALQGDLRRAGDAANRLVAFRHTPSNLGVRGTVRGAQGDAAAAVRTFEEGLALDPGEPVAAGRSGRGPLT